MQPGLVAVEAFTSGVVHSFGVVVNSMSSVCGPRTGMRAGGSTVGACSSSVCVTRSFGAVPGVSKISGKATVMEVFFVVNTS